MLRDGFLVRTVQRGSASPLCLQRLGGKAPEAPWWRRPSPTILAIFGSVLYGDSSTPRDEAYRRTRDAALAMLSLGLRGTERDVVISPSGADLHVTVRYRTNVFVPFLRPWLGDRLELERESIYRIERDTA